MESAQETIDKAVQVFINQMEEEKAAEQLPSNTLNEPQTVFQKKTTYRSLLQNQMLIVQSIRRGVPYFLFDEIQKQTPFTEEDWADFLNISTKSMQRYKAAGNHIFKPIHSEKIFELAEVTELGKEVFDNSDNFYRWLDTPITALGGHKPSELIRNSYGKELVLDALHRIDRGIFS